MNKEERKHKSERPREEEPKECGAIRSAKAESQNLSYMPFCFVSFGTFLFQ